MQDRIQALRRLLGDALDSVEATRLVLDGSIRRARSQVRLLEEELAEKRELVRGIESTLKKAEVDGERARAEVQGVLDRFGAVTADEIRRAYYHSSKLVFAIAEGRKHRELLLMDLERLDALRRRTLDEIVSLDGDLSSLDLVIGSLHEYLVGPVGGGEGATALDLFLYNAQEDEKKNVAGRIHDGAAQTLANLVMRLDFCKKLIEKDAEAARVEVEEIRDETQAVLEDVRDLIFELRPMTLDDLGLYATLSQFVDHQKQVVDHDLQLVVRGGQRRFPRLVEGLVFRIVQEGVRNVALHAKAGRCRVFLRLEEDGLRITVEDDGLGFDAGQLATFVEEGKLGLHHIRSWAALSGGTWTLVTSPGKGTRHELHIPFLVYEEGE